MLKDVCGVETRQMKSATALQRTLVLDMIVAWRTLLLCRLGKEQPNLPASLHYSAQELAILDAYKKKLPLRVRSAESSSQLIRRQPEDSPASPLSASKAETTAKPGKPAVQSSGLS